MKNKKPQLNIDIIIDNYYWVRPFENDKFEPAKCNFYAKELYFFFTNGSRMPTSSAWEVKSLVESTNNDILEKEIRATVAEEIKSTLKYAMENCTALGRDAYGDYIDSMVNMIINKINKKII